MDSSALLKGRIWGRLCEDIVRCLTSDFDRSRIRTYRIMRYLVSFFFVFLSFLPVLTQACLVYYATFPFDNDKPFVGKIIDNGIETCSINMTYNEHWRWQALENEKDWEREEWAWKPWHFTCTKKLWQGKIKGNNTHRTYAAELGVGLRGVTYHAHGEKFWFNPDTVEDVAGERWVYSKKLWCAGK
ncbi:uncharacterized protein EAE97_000495 [Botrytis byssoidea]|uniref:Uncharacterized protein n=1 Tax=Botrytis byssoidea TaxID=139641 RepID=A0A9P5IZ38_9HELO|nr:uncharacterized protein EAE97_000495 [Botrytis byssoidea]KAF7955236.1 hypothetical protein EAE97_000495 [Botrytis byssoidea]